MRIAILVTNTDRSAFAAGFPRDGEKFRTLLQQVRPTWQFSIYELTTGQFPEQLNGIDGVVITGSPASVHDPDVWVAQLFVLIRQIVAAGVPLFGGCFGHQAIAQALGGQVARNPGGWSLGRVDSRTQSRWIDAGPLRLYAAHQEQVTCLPSNARSVGSSEGCPCAAFEIGAKVWTTQYHPELTDDFFDAFIGHMDGKLPARTITQARLSMQGPETDRARMAEAMAGFLEQA